MVGVGGDSDGVGPARPHAACEEPAEEPADAEFFVAEHVRDDVADPPLRAQRRRFPLGRGQRGEQVGEVGPFVAGQAHRVHGGGHDWFGHGLGEAVEQQCPSAAAADRVVDGLAADETVEVAVFDLDGGLAGPVGGEPGLDLAGVVGVGVELPRPVDLPGEHQPVRRLPGQHPAPVAFGAVDAALVPAPADAGLQDHFGHLGLADVVLVRPPRVDRAGEHPEGLVDGHAEVTVPVIGGIGAVVVMGSPVRGRVSRRAALGGLVKTGEGVAPDAVEPGP